jgi:alanyl-tRNA synthetase
VVRLFAQASESIARAAEALRAAPSELPQAAARVAGETQARRKTIDALEATLAAYQADQLVSVHPQGAIVETVSGGMQAAKLLAGALVARGRIALIASPEGDRVHLCFARPPGAGAAMNAVLKSILSIIGGKGGGSAEIAQGSGSAERMAEALSAARKQIDTA